MTWRVKWIKKSDFDAIKCTSEYVTFDITQNSRCFYEGKILDFSPLLFLNNPQVPDKKHFEGNFVGNTWLIEEEDIPDYIDNNELYALIIYEKQLWYI